MAEDVLTLAGFVEGIQYRKQVSVEGGRGIPDFTFLLPRGVVLYMDVKFPLDNYLRYLDAESDFDAAPAPRRLPARRARQGEGARGTRVLATRPRTPSTASCCSSPTSSSTGSSRSTTRPCSSTRSGSKIVMCSPLTLFAVLAVVRQAVDSFRLERTTSEILDVLGTFSKQWDGFVTQMDTLGKRLESTASAYDQLVGARRRQLERQLDRIEDLRTDQALALTGGWRAAPAARGVAGGAPRYHRGMAMVLILVFIVVPLVELAVFVQVAQWIGVVNTTLLLLLVSVRRRSSSSGTRASASTAGCALELRTGVVPAAELVERAPDPDRGPAADRPRLRHRRDRPAAPAPAGACVRPRQGAQALLGTGRQPRREASSTLATRRPATRRPTSIEVLPPSPRSLPPQSSPPGPPPPGGPASAQ